MTTSMATLAGSCSAKESRVTGGLTGVPMQGSMELLYSSLCSNVAIRRGESGDARYSSTQRSVRVSCTEAGVMLRQCANSQSVA